MSSIWQLVSARQSNQNFPLLSLEFAFLTYLGEVITVSL